MAANNQQAVFGMTDGGNHSNWLPSSCIDSDIIK